MNLPLPEISDFYVGFASCAAGIAIAVAGRHVWPKVKALFAPIESKVYAEYKVTIQFLNAKLDGLSTTFATAVNAIRGDVQGVQKGLAYLEDRIFTLEKAVGIQDPTADKAGLAAAKAAGVDGLGSVEAAPAAVPLA